jgi:phosphatidylglycerophosphate synthase
MKVEAQQLMGDAMRSILAAAVLGVAISWIASAALGLDLHYLFRTVALLCMGAPLLLWRLAAYHPFNRLGIANHITMARGVLTALLAALVGAGSETRLQAAAFSVAMIASALDGIDGWSARRTGMSSSYGARFDMETDALLILVLSLLAWQFDKAGAWVLGSGLLRYAFVAASWLLPWLQRPLPPSRRRKAVAAIQTVTLVIAIATFVPNIVSAGLCAVSLALLMGSFALDIAWLKRHTSAVPAVS